MAWVKLDDQAPRHHKMLQAGPAACWLWVCGIAYGQSHMTNGFIPDLALPMIGVTGAARARRLADALVIVGLFERVDQGYQVHDYLEFNETREEALARKVTLGAQRAASGRAGGIASGIARSKEANEKQSLQAKRSPDPTRPDPTLKEKKRARPRNGAPRGAVCSHEPRCERTKDCIEKCIRERPAS